MAKAPPKTKATFSSLKVAAENAEIEGVKKLTAFNVDPRLVTVEPGFNRPIDEDHVKQFMVAIESGSTIPAIDVRVEDGVIILVDGEHRWRAVMALIAKGKDIKTMSANEFKGNDAERYLHQIKSSQGLGMSPLVAGTRFQILINFGWSKKQIADRIGSSVGHVDQCLTLAGSDSDVQQAVRRGEVSSTVAIAAVRKHGYAAGAVIAKKLVSANAKGKTKVTASVMNKSPSKGKMTDLAKSLGEFLTGKMTKKDLAVKYHALFPIDGDDDEL